MSVIVVELSEIPDLSSIRRAGQAIARGRGQYSGLFRSKCNYESLGLYNFIFSHNKKE